VVGHELEPDQADDGEDEDAELEDAEDRPGGIDAGDRVEEGAAELLLDRRRRAEAVEDLFLSGVEDEDPQQEVDAGEDQAVDDTVL
jgi:hypothetical protein